jgi:signal transduction histidine kinase
VRSLLGRSVAAAVVSIVVALVIVGIGVGILTARDVHRSLDSSLRQRAVSISQLSASAPALLTRPGALDTTVGGAPLSVEVLDRHRRLVARSLSLGGRRLPAAALALRAIATGRGSYGSAVLDGDRLRLYAAPLADLGGPAAGGAVVVAASRQDADRTVGNLHLFLVAAGLAAALFAGLAVALLLRRALRPLTRLADAAAEVERTGDPTRRLPVPEADDEIARLATTLNAMLRSLERSRDLERRFLADASHELRTPLTALRGNVDYIAQHGASPQVLEDLQHDAERLARLADDLLVLSREEGAPRAQATVRLDVVAEEAAAHEPRVDVVAAPVSVTGDEQALRRALGNLIENARVHGPPGGRISVTVEEQNGTARVSVEDEGTGLRAEEEKLAFIRFWRGSSGRPGSGLGLAIVQATAARHGGRAFAEGSRFTIELPALRDLSSSPGTTEAIPEKGRP